MLWESGNFTLAYLIIYYLIEDIIAKGWIVKYMKKKNTMEKENNW